MIGDIEPYPVYSKEELIAWVDALNAKLKEMNSKPIAFLMIDPNWASFHEKDYASWKDLKILETACRERGVKFTMCYWASDYGLQRMMDLEDESTWYISVMRQGIDYALADGYPDEYVIESWTGLPPKVIPETENYTFTNSVLDFIKRFAR